MTIKDWKYVKIKRVNLLCFIFNRVNGYFEEINGNKYLTLFPTNQSKEKTKSKTKNSEDCNKKYIKIKFNSDDKLPLNK